MSDSRAEYFREYRSRPEVKERNRLRNQESFRKDPERHRGYSRRYRQRHPESWKRNRDARREWLWALKAAPCSRCGQQFHPVAMDWHHRDPTTKLFNINNGGGRGKEAVMAEIAKCDLLCAVCHRLVEHIPA